MVNEGTVLLPDKIKNPVLKGFHPDPSVCVVGDDYYIAVSTFEWYPGVQIYHSKNLQDWTLVCRPLNRPALLDLTGVPDSCGVWAPCLTYSGGKFWLAYTIVNRFDGDFKDTHNYLTTATEIDGEWTDPVYLNSSGFDPSFFHDLDGRIWLSNMVWDHRPGRTYFRGIVLQEYSSKDAALVGPRKIIFDGTRAGFTEGSHIYKKNDYYYLMTAEGGTGYDHAVTFVRSKNIWGPYEEHPDLHVITARNIPEAGLQRTGHGSYFETSDGRCFISHLCSRPLEGLRNSPLGRESAIQEVVWSDDDWLRLKDENAAFLSDAEETQSRHFYDFSSQTLHSDFQWLRTPRQDDLFSIDEVPNALRVYGRESIGSQFKSALIARRQQHFSFRAETSMTFNPSDFQQMAGLTAYYNSHKFHYLYMSFEPDMGRVLGIMSCAGDQTLSSTFPIADAMVTLPDEGKVYLAMEVQKNELQFMYSLTGKDWIKVGPILDASILSDEAGKGEGANFTGNFVGLCCQDLTGQALPADFDYFVYKGI